MSASEEKPKVTLGLMRRVLTYAAPYRWQIVGMLLLILADTALTLLMPLVIRDLIDRTIPSGDINRLILLALALLLIPGLRGGISVIQRRLNSWVGEGVIFDLRVALFSRLQRMSLRFFTNTKTGELMSRLNNDVVGAQNAISSTIVGIITNIIETAALMVVMLTMEWRLTLVSVAILPLFVLAARKLGTRLRDGHGLAVLDGRPAAELDRAEVVDRHDSPPHARGLLDPLRRRQRGCVLHGRLVTLAGRVIRELDQPLVGALFADRDGDRVARAYRKLHRPGGPR